MERNRQSLAFVVLFAAVVSACGGSGGGTPNQPSADPTLSAADVSRINNAVEAAIGAAFTNAFSGSRLIRTLAAGRPRPLITEPINFNGPCGERGRVTITGSIDVPDSGDTFTLNELINFGSRSAGTNCVSEGVSLEGDPNLSITARITLDSADSAVLTEQVTNGVTFVLPSSPTVGRVRYNCTLNYRVTSSGAFTGSSSGTVTTEYPLGKNVNGAVCPQL